MEYYALLENSVDVDRIDIGIYRVRSGGTCESEVHATAEICQTNGTQ